MEEAITCRFTGPDAVPFTAEKQEIIIEALSNVSALGKSCTACALFCLTCQGWRYNPLGPAGKQQFCSCCACKCFYPSLLFKCDA